MKVSIVANTQKERIKTILPQFLTLLGNDGIDAVLHDGIRPILGGDYLYAASDTLFDGSDMIISFGGDGTILYTTQLSMGKSLPVLGVNLGKVGFLAEISPEEIDIIPGKLKKGDYEVIDRMAFEVESTDSEPYYALNDIVLDRNMDTRILRMTVTIDDQYAGEFHADGLIVSTPTGSTAHSMSAGGPLVMPECKVSVLTPICPHSLTIRPMIIDGAAVLRLHVVEGQARMAVDGQSFVTVDPGKDVIIRKAESPVRVARFRDKTYFDILHTRLRWGVSLKLKNA